MSNHTPGPWRIGPKLQGASFTIVNPNSDAEMGNWLVARAHWEQDAQLIAAAPELLAALKNLYEAAVGSPTILPRAFLESAAAAIAKAEGKS